MCLSIPVDHNTTEPQAYPLRAEELHVRGLWRHFQAAAGALHTRQARAWRRATEIVTPLSNLLLRPLPISLIIYMRINE